MSVMDNTAAEVAERVDRIALITDILADVLPTTECFSGNPFLVPDPVRMAEIRQQLPDGGPLIGLNWRSSITLQSRMEHYVSVQDLAPLFEQTDFQFVNLQYDDCEEEIAWIEERFPGRVFQVQDLNQYDDLDGVAALLKCLDLVIAPCTTVAELSGAVDQQTFILANSSELQWRIRPEDGRDIWHRSMEHIQGNVYRDKASLVTALIAKLRDWATRRN
jgi:capsular polysaccharide export protein